MIKPIAKLVLFLSFCLLVAMVVVLLHMLHVLDWSMQTPVSRTVSQQQTDYYLLTYADGDDIYFQNRNILAASAINRGFDFILNYRRNNIDPAYIAANPILLEKSGSGFWLWKPYIILQALNAIPEGTVIMYADSGLLIRQPLLDFLDAGLNDRDILLFNYDPSIYGTAGTIASGDTFVAINCLDTDCHDGHHVWAGIIALRNSKQSRDFIAEWLKHCEDPDLLKGVILNTPNFPEFVHHQHDEGILSVLSTRDKQLVNFMPMNKDFHKHINMHRRKSEEQSLLGFISIQYRHLERRLPNWWWINKLRTATLQKSP